MTNQFKRDAETTKGNRKHAQSKYNDNTKTIKLSRIETKVLEHKSRQK